MNSVEDAANNPLPPVDAIAGFQPENFPPSEFEVHRPKQWATMLGRAGLCILAGGAIGGIRGFISSANDEIPTDIGGIPATAQIKPGSHIVSFNGGIIGARGPSNVQIAGIRLPVGAEVSIKSEDISAPESSQLLNSEILQLFSDPSYIKKHVSSNIIDYVKNKTENGATEGAAIMLGGLIVFEAWEEKRKRLSGHDRQALDRAWQISRPFVASATGLAMAAGVVGIGQRVDKYVSQDRTRPIAANPVFDKTTLHGWEMNGLASAVVESGVSAAQDFIAQTDSYYNAVVDSFNKAFADFSKTREVPMGDNIVPMMVVSDRHCNTAMDRVIEQVAKKFGVLILLDPGDDYLNSDLPLGGICTASFAQRIKALGVKMVVVNGNHDPDEIVKTEEQQGMNNLTGEDVIIKTKKGSIDFLGARDPRHSNVGSEIQPFSPEEQARVTANLGQKLGKKACETESKKILIAHDERTVSAAMASGCDTISLGISGHTHHFSPPEKILGYLSPAFAFTEGTSGGVSPDTGQIELKIGPLQDDATESIVWYDTSAQQSLGMVNIVSHPSTLTEISDYIPMAKQLSNTPHGHLEALSDSTNNKQTAKQSSANQSIRATSRQQSPRRVHAAHRR